MQASEYKQMQNALRMHREALARYGLAVDLVPGLAGWRQLITGVHGVNPTLDPEANKDVTEANSLWLRVSDSSGTIAGMIALRVFDGHQKMSFLIRSGRYWWPIANALDYDMTTLDLPEELETAQGRIAIMGGLYVWDEWRGLRMGWHLTRMVRLAAILLFDCDHVCGYVLDALHNASMPDYYGHVRSVKAVEAFKLPDEPAPVSLYVTHSARHETMARLDSEVEELDRILGDFLDADPQQLRAAV